MKQGITQGVKSTSAGLWGALPLWAKGIIVVGHTKRSTVIDEDHNKVVDINELNLTGKLKNELMSAADAIGFVYREGGELKISFKSGSDNTQTGSRCPHLADQILDFKWEHIFID